MSPCHLGRGNICNQRLVKEQDMRDIDQLKESLEITSTAIEEEAQKIAETSGLLSDNLVKAVRIIWRQLVFIWVIMIVLLIAYVSILYKKPFDRAPSRPDQNTTNSHESISKDMAVSSSAFPSPAGPSESFLTLLNQIREAQQKKDIDLFLSAYSPDFPDIEKKREKTLTVWKAYDFLEIHFQISDLQQKDALNFLGKVAWNIKAQHTNNKKIKISLQSYQVGFSKESGRWLIQNLKPLNENK